MACSFIAELSKLRKLSVESVENTNSFDDFKRYMHVLRPVETELRKLLVDVNDSNHKTLVLLCGSAGDGKSHLLSYLRNADQEHLLDSYEVYNDATESSAPQLTSIDTLSEKLAPFNDQNYTIDDGFKMILAINLGTLNNFIESEKGKNFSALKKYVEDKEIFSSFVRDDSYQTGSVFQHISFSDYQIFTLSENGVETDYLEELIRKIFQDQEANPFFKAFKENSNCSLCQKCPVRHNYQFLSNPIHQKALIKKIIEVVIDQIESSENLPCYTLVKLAMALSLRSKEPLAESDFHTNTLGRELNRQTITGDADAVYKCVMELYAGKHLTDEEFFPTYVKAHIDRGAILLEREQKYSSNFLVHLTEL